MGDNTKADNKILAAGTPVRTNYTKDVFVFVPAGAREAIRCEVSIEVCGEDWLEDMQCDISIDLEEAVTKAVVGRFGLIKKSRYSEYTGSIKLA